MLDILMELEQGKAYDLLQLGEHIGTEDPDELGASAFELREKGFVELLESQDAGRLVVVLISPTGNGEPGNSPKKEEKSIIAEANVNFMSSVQPVKGESSTRSKERGVITTSVDLAPAVSKAAPQQSPIEAITIGEILNALASAVENSPDIKDKEKWPLVEKINAVVSSKDISPWLKAPIKTIVGR